MILAAVGLAGRFDLEFYEDMDDGEEEESEQQLRERREAYRAKRKAKLGDLEVYRGFYIEEKQGVVWVYEEDGTVLFDELAGDVSVAKATIDDYLVELQRERERQLRTASTLGPCNTRAGGRHGVGPAASATASLASAQLVSLHETRAEALRPKKHEERREENDKPEYWLPGHEHMVCTFAVVVYRPFDYVPSQNRGEEDEEDGHNFLLDSIGLRSERKETW